MDRKLVRFIAPILFFALSFSSALAQDTELLFDKERAWQHLITQCEFGPRVPGSEAHANCREYLFDQLKASCNVLQLQPFKHRWSVTGKDVQMWNVVGTQNWENAKHRVVLLAHWDSRPYADAERDHERARIPVVGANDGASGVAVLLEIARVMKGRCGDLGIMYLLTDGEDLGPSLSEMFLGARAFVKDMPDPRPDYGILLDMIGDKDLVIPMEPNSYKHAKNLLRDFFDHARGMGFEAHFSISLGPPIADDHGPLNEVGIPTIDLIDFDYDPWHTVNDTPEQCSADSLYVVGAALESWLLGDKHSYGK